ncbi:MAG TPA: glutathione S-transferase [Caulobacteraceae bacterium]|jgi:glutathione S-transferase|nr:glutathione S-transferase [Caulobacteraceae bacterium]
MKLYTHHRAPNPRRVRWLMAEKAISDLQMVEVDIFAGEHKTPAYREKAGLAHVPALELDDGVTITESIAICRYLEAVYPEPNLLGRDAEEIAVIEMWTRRCEIYLANPLMQVVRHTHPMLAALEPPVPAVADYMRAASERFMAMLDRRLDGRPFIAAERITTADIVAAVGIDFARLVKYRPPAELVNLDRWLSALKERPGFLAGAEAKAVA